MVYSPQNIELKRVAILIWITCAILIVYGANTLSHAESKTPAVIIPYDSITYPGIESWPQAKVIVKKFYGLERPAGGERIEFRDSDKSLGVALTGGDGVGVIRYIPYEEGLHRIKIRLDNNSDYKAEDVEMIVGVWDKSRPVLLVSANALMERNKEVTFPFIGKVSKEDEQRPVTSATEVLSDLAKRFNIIYLFSGALSDFQETRSWISRNNFPFFPVIIWNENVNYIKRLLSDRKQDIKGVILTKENEEDLFRKEQIKIILLIPKKKKSVNKGKLDEITIINDWKEIKKALSERD